MHQTCVLFFIYTLVMFGFLGHTTYYLSQLLYTYLLLIHILASDFVGAPVTIIIPPGDTSMVVSIPVIDDMLVERNERFDVVLQPQGNEVIIGDPGKAEVIIVNDDGECIIKL